MTKPYSKERKIEILTYARDHGVIAAKRHFKVPYSTIRQWNLTFNIYTPQTHGYPIEKQREILRYVARHNSIRAAMERFGVSRGTIENWNQELNIYKSPQRKFTDEQKLEILYYARDNGVFKAADKYEISNKTICDWNKKFQVYQEQKEYSPDERKNILMFARDNGVTATEREFNVPNFTLMRWNEEYKIYIPKQAPDYVHYCEPERIELLNRAKQIYDALPEQLRTANRAFGELAENYPVTVDQLSAWNKKYKIVPSRKYKKTPISQAEIDAAQSALTAARGRLRRAARESGLPLSLITKLKKDKKIAFTAATAKMRTNPPVGRRKAAAISGLIQMLQRSAKQGNDA